jgi:anti-anti-sigma regulatory factor
MSEHRTLPAELSIYSVGELKGQWLGWISEAPAGPDAEHWALDASTVSEVDAAGLQLLVALSHTLSQQDLRLVLLHPSAALSEACAAIGLGDWLGQHLPECRPEGVPA